MTTRRPPAPVLGDQAQVGPAAGTIAVDGFFLISGFLITRSRLQASSAVTYVMANSLLRTNQFNIGDLYAGEPLDGSLHTLFFEVLCYLMTGIFGGFGLLRRSRLLVVLSAVSCWFLVEAPALALKTANVTWPRPWRRDARSAAEGARP